MLVAFVTVSYHAVLTFSRGSITDRKNMDVRVAFEILFLGGRDS
jgi:hypothetical protein